MACKTLTGLAFFVVCVGTLGCTSGPHAGGDSGADAQTGRFGVNGALCDGLPASSLDALWTAYFAPSRATGCAAAGCHARGAGGFAFTSAHELWEAAVGKPTSTGTGLRVMPGDPTQSEFYKRLLAGAPKRMPRGGPYLDSKAVTEVAGWICAGAPEPETSAPDAGADAALVEGGSAAKDAGADGTTAQTGDLIVSGFSPTEGVAGTMVTLTGSGFSADPNENLVSFRGAGGADVAAVVVSASPSLLVVTVPAGATTGPIRIEVMGRATSTASDFLVITISPKPTLSSLTPATAVAGSSDLTITVHGADFVAVSAVELDGDILDTRYVDETTLSATIPAARLATPGSHTITVTTRGPGGGTSAGAAFAVENQPPAISLLAPDSVVVGSGPVTLSVMGSGFVASSQITLNGAAGDTSYVSATELSVIVPANLVASLGAVQVVVTNPPPGGGTSSPSPLVVGNPVPSLSSVTPASALAGVGSLALTLAGSGFVAGSVVQLDGASLTTIVDSATQLEASIDPAITSVGGLHEVSVLNPAPGGGTSASQSLVINNPVPAVTSLSPSQVATQGAAFTLTVQGSGFNPASVVSFDGVARPTTFESPSTLKAQIPSIAAAGNYAVAVTNPAPAGGGSNSLNLVAATSSAPTITGLSPQSSLADVAFALTVSGSGYTCAGSPSQLLFNGVAVSVSSCSATELVGAIPATPSGSYSVQIMNTSASSNTLSYPVVQPNPVPSLSSLTPNTAIAGSAAFTLGVHGAGFVSGAVVAWNGSARTTVFVSASELTASIPASDLVTAADAQVTVSNPAPGGGTSAALTFSTLTLNPVPSVTDLTPASVDAGSGAVHVRITGTGFMPGSSAAFNASARTTDYVSSTELGIALTDADTSSAANDAITVSNPAPGGGTSGPFTFAVLAPNPVPTLSSLSPTNVLVGGSAFSLTLDGSGFVPSSSASWNGVAKPTSYVSATRLTASISAADIASAGSYSVLVTSPAPGGGSSAALQFEVSNPAPSITSLAPSTVTAGSGAFSLTINGSGFVTGSTVQLDGSARTTHFVNATQLTADLLAADDSTPTTHAISVQNLGPGGGTSAAATLTVASQANPVPTLVALSPCGAVAGGGTFTLTIQGAGFVAGASASFNGTAVSTSVTSATELSATIPAALIASAPSNNVAPVVVSNPAPGGGPSSSVNFGVATQTSTLAGNVQTIFSTSCTNNCHGNGGGGPMSLVTGQAYSALVGANSSGCGGRKRVLACGPLRSQSVLVDKIRATSASPACAGLPMPRGRAALSAAQQQLIVDWVAQGAPQ